MASLRDFADDMARLAIRFEKDADLHVRGAAREGARVAVGSTPVVTGRMRGSWRGSFGASSPPVNSSVGFGGFAFDRNGGATLARIYRVINLIRVSLNRPFFLQNNVVYSNKIDRKYGISNASVRAANAFLNRARLASFG